MKKVINIFLLSFVFLSCSLEPMETSEENKEESNENTFVEEDNTFFENTSNAFIFETNDTHYITPKGYTIWTTIKSNGDENFENVEASLCKESGKSDAGYGIVFLSQEINNKDKFLVTIMINTKGQYLLGKVINGEFITISDWKSSNYLYTGYGIFNQVKVAYEESVFKIYFNESYITDLKLEEQIVFKNSKSGYVAVISKNENFPSKSVKIIYKNIKE